MRTARANVLIQLSYAAKTWGGFRLALDLEGLEAGDVLVLQRGEHQAHRQDP